MRGDLNDHQTDVQRRVLYIENSMYKVYRMKKCINSARSVPSCCAKWLCLVLDDLG